MRYHRRDVVDRAVHLLDEVGLDGLSMRRLAADLGVQPSALYHHVASRQELLGAVADELLARGRRPREVLTWQDELRLACVELRDAMLRHRDGAALVALARASGAGGAAPLLQMEALLRFNGADDELARAGARALVNLVSGHVVERQADHGAVPVVATSERDFAIGLDVVLIGLEARLRVPSR